MARVDPIYTRVTGGNPHGLVRSTEMAPGDEVEVTEQVLVQANPLLVHCHGSCLRLRNGEGWDQYREVERDPRRKTRIFVFEEIVVRTPNG